MEDNDHQHPVPNYDVDDHHREDNEEDDANVQTGWHQYHREHFQIRRNMVNAIARQMQQPNPNRNDIAGTEGVAVAASVRDSDSNPTEEERNRYRVARTVEWYLYRNAMSREEYEDNSTLRERMREAVRNIYSSAGVPIPRRHQSQAHVILGDDDEED